MMVQSYVHFVTAGWVIVVVPLTTWVPFDSPVSGSPGPQAAERPCVVLETLTKLPETLVKRCNPLLAPKRVGCQQPTKR